MMENTFMFASADIRMSEHLYPAVFFLKFHIVINASLLVCCVLLYVYAYNVLLNFNTTIHIIIFNSCKCYKSVPLE